MILVILPEHLPEVKWVRQFAVRIGLNASRPYRPYQMNLCLLYYIYMGVVDTPIVSTYINGRSNDYY